MKGGVEDYRVPGAIRSYCRREEESRRGGRGEEKKGCEWING